MTIETMMNMTALLTFFMAPLFLLNKLVGEVENIQQQKRAKLVPLKVRLKERRSA